MSALRILEKHELANVHPVGINPGKMHSVEKYYKKIITNQLLQVMIRILKNIIVKIVLIMENNFFLKKNYQRILN